MSVQMVRIFCVALFILVISVDAGCTRYKCMKELERHLSLSNCKATNIYEFESGTTCEEIYTCGEKEYSVRRREGNTLFTTSDGCKEAYFEESQVNVYGKGNTAVMGTNSKTAKGCAWDRYQDTVDQTPVQFQPYLLAALTIGLATNSADLTGSITKKEKKNGNDHFQGLLDARGGRGGDQCNCFHKIGTARSAITYVPSLNEQISQPKNGRDIDEGSYFYASKKINENQKVIMVSFHGTITAKQGLTDIKVFTTSFDAPGFTACKAVKVHGGFKQYVDKTFERIDSALNMQLLEHLLTAYFGTNNVIFLTGHSLGGASAILVAAETLGKYSAWDDKKYTDFVKKHESLWKKTKFKPPAAADRPKMLDPKRFMIVTIGSPKVGLEAWKKCYETPQAKGGLGLRDRTLRLVDGEDFVPNYPGPYSQVGFELLRSCGEGFLDCHRIKSYIKYFIGSECETRDFKSAFTPPHIGDPKHNICLIPASARDGLEARNAVLRYWIKRLAKHAGLRNAPGYVRDDEFTVYDQVMAGDVTSSKIQNDLEEQAKLPEDRIDLSKSTFGGPRNIVNV